MKKEWGLRQEMIVRFALSALVPVVIFAIATQINMQRNQKQYLEEQIENTLQNADRGLDRVLDKYMVILNDLCTDEKILAALKEAKNEGNVIEADREILCRELKHICDKDSGIVGVTISLPDGETIFYDSLSASSTNSTWADRAGIPEIRSGVVYRGGKDSIIVNKKMTYIFQIARNLVDSQSRNEIMGTAVLSINENQIQNALDGGQGASTYLLDGNIIISAAEKSDIGRDFEEFMNPRENKYTSVLNPTSGMIIWNEQPLDFYYDFMQSQNLLLCVIALFSAAASVLLTYSFTRPYLKVVDSYVNAMNRVQEGDFTVRAKADTKIPVEMRRIGHGFNEMVDYIRNLIEQVKQASMEQRSAELSALEAQIDPHFLYNTLDVINWKAIENEQYEISEMLGALADILRYTVKNAGGTATLQEGLMWLEHYLLLQSAKLGKIPKLEIKVPDELMKIQTHKLLIQPFVENAMKYAFAEKEEQCVLTVSANLMDGQLHLILEDNGKGIEPEILEKLNDETADMGEHVGVVNVRKRLKLYYGEDAQVYFESMPDSYTRVHLFIPIKEEYSCG